MKICFRCNIEKPLTEYYKHKQMADGHLNKCRDCTKSDSKKHLEKIYADPEKKIKEQARHREKYYRLNYLDKHKPSYEVKKSAMERYKNKFPEKIAAHSKSGNLIAPEKGLEKHHWSYNVDHYKDVIWLTNYNHNKAHRFIIYDQEQMMYRRIDNMQLLDTKEAHENYINHVIENEF